MGIFCTADSSVYLQFAALKNRPITGPDTTKSPDLGGLVEYNSHFLAMSVSLSKANKSQKVKNII